MRVDDRFPFRCGQVIRERGGCHEAVVIAVIFDQIKVRWKDTGWVSFFEMGDIEEAGS